MSNNEARNNLIVIVGATASGKSALAMELANRYDIEIISADSRQIFKYMDIGTAKPSPDEQNKVKHHFIDSISPEQYYSSGIFGKEANLIIEDVYNRGKIPVVVGGSGLYIKALCEGFFEEEKDDKLFEIREQLNARFENEGIDKLYSELKDIDLASYNLYHEKNPRRIIRALEYYLWKGLPFSEAHKVLLPSQTRNFTPIYFALDFERKTLYNRINIRVDTMIEDGLINEVKSLLERGFKSDMNSLNTVGYKEIFRYLSGEWTLDFAISEIKKNTRRFAKRQLTWFRKYENMNWIKADESSKSSDLVEVIEKYI